MIDCRRVRRLGGTTAPTGQRVGAIAGRSPSQRASGGKTLLVRKSTREGVEVPAAVKEPVAWVIGRAGFERGELERAFPALAPERLDAFLAQMERMRVIEPN